MKINFDLLFAQSKQQSWLSNNVFQIPQSQKQQSYSQILPFSGQSLALFTRKQLIKQSDKNDQLLINQNKINTKQTITSLENLPIKQIKKLKVAKSNEYVSNLFRPFVCNKKGCKQYKTSKQIQKLQNKYQVKILNKINRIQQNSKQHFDRSMEKCPTYLRLYNKGKIKSKLKEIYKEQNEEYHPQILQTKRSKKYQQKYIPFYDRLDSQIKKSIEKEKYFNKNPHLSSNQQKKFFQISLLPNKYHDKVQSRYYNYQRSNSKETLQTELIYNSLNNSFNSSFCSSQVSMELIYQVQEHFFNRMKYIFVDQSSEFVQITQDTIKLISQVQFKIIQKFIIEIQNSFIKNDQFEPKLRQFYYNLPIHQKIQLRNYERKKKYPKTNKERNQYDQNSKKYQKVKVKKNNKINVNSQYLKKIQYYV